MTETVVEQLELDADLLALRSLEPWLQEVLDEAGASEAKGGLELALHEICVNVVTHAYADGPGRIQIRARCDADSIELEVRDQASVAFDWSTVVDPVPGVPQIHGHGLMIVRKLVDELTYTREEGTNIWLLRSRR